MKQRDDGDHWDSSHVAEVDVDVELGFGHELLSHVCIGERSVPMCSTSSRLQGWQPKWMGGFGL